MSYPPPRLLPTKPFPEYSYVPGLWPHPHRLPTTDGREAAVALPPEEEWRSCEPYLYGIDLWNNGYYWEAHEEWERLWHAAGRRGPGADFFKGLIQLAVAGVKARQGIAEGVRTHARRGGELFRGVRDELHSRRFFGLWLEELIQIATELETMALDGITSDKVRVVAHASLAPCD